LQDPGFIQKYEEEIQKIFKELSGEASYRDEVVRDEHLIDVNTFFAVNKVLADRREMGVKKYGDVSFQTSRKNAYATPILQHFKEELYDALNYLMHWAWLQEDITGSREVHVGAIKDVLGESFYHVIRLLALANKCSGPVNEKKEKPDNS
jgi:hypothetical protein